MKSSLRFRAGDRWPEDSGHVRTAFGVADPGRFRPESLLGARTRRGRFEIRRRARMPLRPPADRLQAIYAAVSRLHPGPIEIAPLPVGRVAIARRVRFALRSLLRRDAAPMKGRSSGFRIVRICTPSQLPRDHRLVRVVRSEVRIGQWLELAPLCSSSPVTATGSRRILTGFP